MSDLTRTCLTVLGMHRSGTSAFTGVLHLLGVNLGHTMLRATEENPKGFFENAKITQVNKTILRQLNSSWDDLFLLQKEWWFQEHLSPCYEQIFDIFESEFAESELIGFKDPRMCILLPFWQQLFEKMHVRPLFPIVIRDPEETAASLFKRNNFSRQKSVILWLNYLFNAEQYSRSFPRKFITFNELLENPLQVIQSISDEFHIHFPNSLEERQTEIRQFLNPGLKHHVSHQSPGEPTLFSIASKFYPLLQELSCESGDAQHSLLSQIDTLRSEYYHVIEWLYCGDVRYHVRALKEAKQEIQRLSPKFHAQVFIDCGLGFNERQAIIKPIQGSERTLEFELSAFHDIQHLRFDPLDDYVAVLIDAIRFEMPDGTSSQVLEYSSNACFQKGRSLIFDTKDSNITFPPPAGQPQKLLIDLNYLALGNPAYQYIYSFKNSTIQEQRQTIREREQTIRQREQTIRQREQMIRQHEQMIRQHEQTIRQHEQTIRQREQTIRQREQTIRQKQRTIEAIQETLSWKLTRPLSRAWNRLSFMSPQKLLRLFRDAYIVWGGKQFDTHYYLKHNPDVLRYRWGAFWHFMIRGVQEGRNPNNTFETSLYHVTHPDVAASKMNPFAHYIRHGRFEGRETKPSLIKKAGSRNGTPKAILPKPLSSKDQQKMSSDRSVSIIILNRDGAAHLDKLFTSFLKYNSYKNIHIIVVDHNSSDESVHICRNFQKNLPLEIITFDENYTFAYSNNYAARQSTSDYLFFLNNDIIFETDVLPILVKALEEKDIGIAGIRLDYPDDHKAHPKALQSVGITFGEDAAYGFYRPANMCHADEIDRKKLSSYFPAVTAAAMLCRRDEFLNIGGFYEKYIYGYEDVDLCLSYRTLLGKRCYLEQNAYLIHDESSTQKNQADERLRERRLNNIHVLQHRYGMLLREEIRQDILENRRFWQNNQTTIAFAVTEAGEHAKAGDYFTAMELAEECRRQFGWNVRYLSKKQGNWYDLEGVHYLVVMRDDYDLSKMYNVNVSLVTIAWMRNWFDRWVEKAWIDAFDIYLCSSQKGVDFLSDFSKEAHLFPIATNRKRFEAVAMSSEKVKTSDYCFTGHFWGFEREIVQYLDPETLDYSFAVYGNGWEAHPKFGKYSKGLIPYENIAETYASTNLVVDDAVTHITKCWGSMNSRVFDALASGVLVITNNEIAAHELFPGELPTYNSATSLKAFITYYLEHDAERQALATRLQQKVLKEHTYAVRAGTLKATLHDFITKKLRIAIKIPVPDADVAPTWGDYHFALALQCSFKSYGHAVRLDLLPDWETEKGLHDDVVLVLRGLSEYLPKPGQINLMWQISHPETVNHEEYERYDHVFVASNRWAEKLQKELQITVSPLLQCTDPRVFFREVCENVPAHDLLFVGNSRKQYRRIVRDCIEHNLPIAVYGTLWENLIPENVLKGTHIENSELHKYYSNARIVLNDHWENMREHGFWSNRLFDAGACGALIISDDVDGMDTIFGETIPTYATPEELQQHVEYYLSHPEEARQVGEQLQDIIAGRHTFANRVETILTTILELKSQKNKACL